MAAIEKRSRIVAHPPFLRGLMAARGVLDGALLDRVLASSIPAMEEAFAAEAERVGPDAAARGVGSQETGTSEPSGRGLPATRAARRASP